MYAITYSSGIDFVANVVSRFQYAEIVFGHEGVLDSDKETTIQSLKGAMREGDYGLFVTLSNYTKNA